MWFRKPIDISFTDLIYATGRSLSSATKNQVKHPPSYRAALHPDEQVIECLSVRTAFDLLLSSLKLRVGSEIIMSAINLPDMAKIARNHGLIVVPADIETNTLFPKTALIKTLITDKTKLILLAQLFGSVNDIAPIATILSRRKILLIEDYAQAFHSSKDFGSIHADITLLSFGTIKTNSCMGGALLIVRRNEKLHRRLNQAHARYPIFERNAFRKRLAKGAFIKILSNRRIFALLCRVANWLNIDYDQKLQLASKTFPKSGFSKKIRQRPCSALILLLRRRLNRFNSDAILERKKIAEQIIRHTNKPLIFTGLSAPLNTFWVFTVLVDDPDKTTARLRRNGFDATRLSSLSTLESDASETSANTALHTLSKIVFIPLSPKMNDAHLRLITKCLRPATGTSPLSN